MDEAMSRTMPQIILMNHAAWCNGKRMEQRMNRNKVAPAATEDDDPIVFNGKRLGELTSEELTFYYAQGA